MWETKISKLYDLWIFEPLGPLIYGFYIICEHMTKHIAKVRKYFETHSFYKFQILGNQRIKALEQIWKRRGRTMTKIRPTTSWTFLIWDQYLSKTRNEKAKIWTKHFQKETLEEFLEISKYFRTHWLFSFWHISQIIGHVFRGNLGTFEINCFSNLAT